jgi:hypothetical protein
VNIVAADWLPYCLPLRRPWQTSRGSFSERHGRLRRLTADDGRRRNRTRRAAQDHLAHRQRSARQRGWLGLQDYVLGMLFYRFISENLTSYLNEQERKAADTAFDYAALSDADAEFGRAETVQEKGFYILPSQLFANVRGGRARTPTSTRPWPHLCRHRRFRQRRDSEDDLQGSVRRPRRQQQQARPHGGQTQRKAGQAARRHRRPAA